MYALYVKIFSSTKKHSHLSDFDSLQSLLSAYLTSLLPSSLIVIPISFLCIVQILKCDTNCSELFTVDNHLQTKHRGEESEARNQAGIASTPVLVGANLMV